jgi:probable F420-dependent oxidoreductase
MTNAIDPGRLGVWYPMDRLDAGQIRDFVARIEGAGYGAVWYPESRGYESLALAGFMLGCSRKLVVGSSIASIYARDAFTAARGALSLNGFYGNRFILGLGVSHRPMVERVRGHEYGKPVPVMRAYLDAMDKAAPERQPVALAALGPLMLKLARDRTLGALPYNVTPAHTAEAKAVVGPDRMLAVEQKVCLETDGARARALGRAELERYLALDNYRNNWLRLGFTEADLSGGGSDRFIDAMVLWGDAAKIRDGLRAHFAAGATHVCLQPVHAAGDLAHRDRMVAALADT